MSIHDSKNLLLENANCFAKKVDARLCIFIVERAHGHFDEFASLNELFQCHYNNISLAENVRSCNAPSLPLADVGCGMVGC